MISHGSAGRLDDKGVAAIRRVYARSSAGEAVARTREEILRFFEGCELVEPGVVTVDEWRPREGEPVRTRTEGAVVYGGVGVVG